MATVSHPSPNHWVLHLASQSDPDSEVTVELRMSKATAQSLAHLESSRIAALNPDANSPVSEDVGSAILTILSSIAAIGRVKKRVGAFDQREIMDAIDNEVDSARAGRTGH